MSKNTKKTKPEHDKRPATAVLIEDAGLLTQAHRIGSRRGDTTTAKTVRDLLRERLTQLELTGDPTAA